MKDDFKKWYKFYCEQLFHRPQRRFIQLEALEKIIQERIVQLQHHAWHRLPTFQLIFVHVIESLVFLPFYDDQMLAFMVLILFWLCKIFTLIKYIYISLSLSLSFSLSLSYSYGLGFRHSLF
ncbi:hypothetical protein Ahy_B04g070868 [Arachis hypogaea]|uniref:Uncharacterized protein n=1 Tax=Arachis hypogaea TaxID=3818 RepID=A0A444ZJL7_ARAHY|nr:hypothetical protein Ahy_B04g070868 [Arachis hypogaea]